jgi:hypothetical protein
VALWHVHRASTGRYYYYYYYYYYLLLQIPVLCFILEDFHFNSGERASERAFSLSACFLEYSAQQCRIQARSNVAVYAGDLKCGGGICVENLAKAPSHDNSRALVNI